MAHMQPVLCELRWLLVEYQIRLMFMVLTLKDLNCLGHILPLGLPLLVYHSEEL